MQSKQQVAQLVLENGVKFVGKAFGQIGQTVGEVVFNTGMTGYQELLSDPSYAGQIVTMTYPLIGNYGLNLEDMESRALRLKGFVVRSACTVPSNWRCEMGLSAFLRRHGVMGFEGIDTRALTKIIRNEGTMRGVITTDMGADAASLSDVFASLDNRNVIRECTIDRPYMIEGSGAHIAFLDMGAKRGLVRGFAQRGCKLTVFPAFSSAQEILAVNPDAVFLSNGPGDPKDVPEIIQTVKELIGKKPILGVCMGNQLLALALGGDTRKMKFGHHGANHPVKDMQSGRVYITSQNHEYVVCGLSKDVEPSFINVNDKTVEGLVHKTLPIFGVQFHPEACPGPLDAGFLFDRFLRIAKEGNSHA